MQYRLAIIGIIGTIIVATLTTGCPQSGSNDTTQVNAQKSGSPVIDAESSSDVKPASETDSSMEAEGVEKVQPEGGIVDDEPIVAENILEFPQREGDPSIEGKWFALFGHHDLGLIRPSWVDGHSIEFRRNGQAFWHKVVNGADVETMDSQWSMGKKNQLKFSFSAANAVETGLSKIAPMGIGSDEEIGLASGSMPGGNASAMKLLDSVMDIQLDHNYLVIRDSYSRLMVYGRESGEDQIIPDGIDGNWVGKGLSNRQFEAQFELTGQKLDALIDCKTSEFSGEFNQGYFVGEMMGPKGIELVAFYYDELGFLDGARYAKPFRVVTMEYEFVKAPDLD